MAAPGGMLAATSLSGPSASEKTPRARSRLSLTLDRIAAELNNRPRKTVGYLTPAEKMSELLS